MFLKSSGLKNDVDNYMLTFERAVFALITARFNARQFHVLPRWYVGGCVVCTVVFIEKLRGLCCRLHREVAWFVVSSS